MANAVEALKAKIAKQDEHIARMISHNPKQPSIKAAVKIADMYRAELAKIQAVR